ncbi:uncharacterized protein TNCT_116321 [Trichonephila clavata]|uniref:Uncharacterized protein n=1 Tax=Trichonephila clavata TaxID=2740835 RepID=A0A8X6HJY4_TRICU|nr:uncharacterized protein TNCT_116321 [Trichonephila clavata]
MDVQSNAFPVTFTDKRTIDENDNNYFGIYSKVVSKIYEIGRQLSTKQEDSIDSFSTDIWKIAPENLFDMESESDADKVTTDKKDFLEHRQNLISTSNLNAIPCDISNPLVSLLPKLEFQDDIWSSLYSSEDNTSESSVLKPSDRSKTGVDSAAHLPSFCRKTTQDSSSDSWKFESYESKNKLIPLFSTSYSHFKSQFKDQWPYIIDSNSCSIPCNNSKNVLDCNFVRSQSSFHLRDSYLKSLAQSRTSIKDASKTLSSKSETDLNNLYHQYLSTRESQNKFLFGANGCENTRCSSIAKLQKCNNPCSCIGISRISVHHKAFKNKLNSDSLKDEVNTQNGRKIKDTKIPNQMKATYLRKLSMSSIADKKSFLRKTKSTRRKSKSHCEFSNLKAISEIKLLSDKQLKNVESNFDFADICENLILKDICLEFPDNNLNRLQFDEPILLNFTKDISGKSRKILICTKDVLENVLAEGYKDDEVIRILLERSKTYTGKPVHIFYEPRKADDSPPSTDSNAEDFVPLHPSRGKHNLLKNKINEKIEEKYFNNVHEVETRYEENCKEENIVDNSNYTSSSKIKNRNSTSGGKNSHNKQNNRLKISCYEVTTHTSESSGKKKLIIRFCRRKKYRTALKRINVKQIASSVFKNFFHFYSLLGGHLYSGSVITKSNSNQWLKEAGVATDARSQEIANELFKAIAGAKIVLNIFDYMQFLIVFARRQKIATMDLVKQLTVCKLPGVINKDRSHSSEFRRPKTSHCPKHAGQELKKTAYRSMSLPNL